MSDTLLLDVTEGVMTVTLHRPDRLNALSIDLALALDETLVAVRRLPLTAQTTARSTRPPSSGKPGIRLKRARIAFDTAR